MGPRKYILVDHVPFLEPNLLKWAEWMGNHDKGVAAWTDEEDRWVSTVFLGLDFQFTPGGPPHLFETMVRDPAGHWSQQVRYSTWDEAVQGHDKAVNLLKSQIEVARIEALDAIQTIEEKER